MSRRPGVIHPSFIHPSVGTDTRTTVVSSIKIRLQTPYYTNSTPFEVNQMNQPDSARLGSDSTPLGSTPLDPSVRPSVRPNVRAPPLRPPCSSFIFSLCFVFISIIVITVYPYSIKEQHIGTHPHRDTLPTPGHTHLPGHPIRNVAMTFYAMTFYAMTFSLSLSLSQSLSISYKKPTER